MKTIALGVAVAIGALAISACGGGGERQDEGEPDADYPVDVVTAKFPNRQQLAGVTDLRLGVENTGDEKIPNLSVTIFIDQASGQSFAVPLEQPRLANPNRPVWVLEETYPRLAGEPRPHGSSPGSTSSSNTYAFGPLEPGDSRDIVWRVTPVKPGTYTVKYQIAAGLGGKAKAVTDDGSPAGGEFVVTISGKPPRATVNKAGKVEIDQ